MITLDNWKAFQTYRQEKTDEAIKDMKQWDKDHPTPQYESKQHKFLFFKWTTGPDPLAQSMAWSAHSTWRKHQKNIAFAYVPEETIEACLNWLVKEG